MGQGVDDPPSITIAVYEQLEAVRLGSTISDSLCLDSGLNRRLGKAATTMGCKEVIHYSK